mgnify:CR=1 FL=1
MNSKTNVGVASVAKQVAISSEVDTAKQASKASNKAKNTNSANSNSNKVSKIPTYHNAVKFKITDVTLIGYLNDIHELFLNEYELINQQNIQPSCFTKKELSHEFRGYFTKKLAELINKDYLKWNLNNKAKYFRMFSLHLRQDFKSLDYRQKITQVLEKYDFNIQNAKIKKKIQDELIKLNLYPTKQELMNICRWHNNANKRRSQCSQERSDEPSNANTKVIPLDFTLGQDKQTIVQPNEKEPVFHINFNGNWIWLNFTDKINKLPYFKNKIDKANFIRFTKPKFVFNHEQNCWFIILTIESKVTFSKSESQGATCVTVAGVDIGQVKPYSAVIVNKDEKNLKASLVSKELTASKETKLINNKLERVKEHLSSIYHKINVYENIIKNNQNQEFTNHIIQKLEERNREKDALRRKRKELQKRKSYLVARDLMRQLIFFNVKKVNIERLNWVEHTGGSWDFSQQQDILEQKTIEHGITVTKVYAANTSKENPFTKKRLLGCADPKTRMVKFSSKKYQIDRDILGAINIALRDKNNQFRLKYNEKKLKKMIIM